MSQRNESLLTTSISILDGSNYLVWLRLKDLWQTMSGNERKFPEAATTEMVAIQQANYKA